MATVFFKLTDQQEKEVKNLMYQEGYTNKAEFFRFLLKFFKYRKSTTEDSIDARVERISGMLIELDKQGKISHKSAKEQLAEL